MGCAPSGLGIRPAPSLRRALRSVLLTVSTIRPVDNVVKSTIIPGQTYSLPRLTRKTVNGHKAFRAVFWQRFPRSGGKNALGKRRKSPLHRKRTGVRGNFFRVFRVFPGQTAKKFFKKFSIEAFSGISRLFFGASPLRDTIYTGFHFSTFSQVRRQKLLHFTCNLAAANR